MHTQSKFRLLVVRLGAMGDILHALPAVTALRTAHPGWIIGWVVEPQWRALLSAQYDTLSGNGRGKQLQPVVDELHFAATRKWRSSPFSSETHAEIGSLRKSLKARDSTQRAHVIEQDIELASAVAGDDLTPMQPWLPVDPSAEAWTTHLLAEFEGAPAVLINPGAGWGAKRWPVERYADVARILMGRGFRVLVNAGPGETLLADTIVKRTGGGAIPLLSSIEQLIAVTRRVALVIAGDTGPLHLACALGRPVVGIYGPTDPSRNGPFGTRFKVLRSPHSRRDHTRHEAPETGLLTITPEDVLHATEELLYPEAAQ